MKDNNKTSESFLDPKFAFLRTTQVLCDYANENTSKTDKKDNPIIFTHSYIITGKIIPFHDINESTSDIALLNAKTIFKSVYKFKEQNFSDEEIDKNPLKILLIKDAKIKSLSSNQITTLPVFLLFADQIVGFSFGHLDWY